MARTLLLVRHATVGSRYAEHYVGSSDLPLAPEGEAQVPPLADWLAEQRGIGLCRVSPRLRARRTAELIAARCPALVFQPDDDFREIDFGQWELRTFPQIAAKFSDRIDAWAAGGDDFTFPGGENRGDFRARVARAAERLVAADADTALAVAHGGVVAEIIRQLLGLGPRHDLAFGIRNATAARIKIVDGKGVLTGLGLPGQPSQPAQGVA